jgi:2-methylcitrate dehydratase PrpD
MTATTESLVDLLLAGADTLSEATETSTRGLMLDVLGVAVAGASTVEGRLVLDVMSSLGRAGECNVPGTDRSFDPATAALITGTMAYSIGLTDTHSESITHPGPSIVPAALAVGQAVKASDADVLRAVVLGVEAVVRIGAVVNPSHRARGFHPTATCNPFGAAVAAAYLLGADKQQMLWALGLAGSMSGGLYEFRSEGAMLMALHGGWPASSGVTAAYLAMAGFTGPTTVLEGPEGFFQGFSDSYDDSKLLANPSSRSIEEVSLRPYCACRYAHAGIDALLRMNDKHGVIDPDQVERVTVWTHRTAVEQESEPTTLVSARLSTCFTIALALVDGPRLDEVTDDDLHNPRILDLARRTDVIEDPELTQMFPKLWPCRVRVQLRSGESYQEQVDTPKGEPSNPLTPDELEGKFRRLATTSLGVRGADAIVGAVLREGQDDLASVLHTLAATATEGGTNDTRA